MIDFITSIDRSYKSSRTDVLRDWYYKYTYKNTDSKTDVSVTDITVLNVNLKEKEPVQ